MSPNKQEAAWDSAAGILAQVHTLTHYKMLSLCTWCLCALSHVIIGEFHLKNGYLMLPLNQNHCFNLFIF